MRVRDYHPRDNSALSRLFAESVKAIDPRDYSHKQLDAWASQAPDIENWLQAGAGRMVLVAEQDSDIAGFATFESTGHIDHLYVHPRSQRVGAASALIGELELRAASLGIGKLFTEASITALPFFEQAGYKVILQQTVTVSGISFAIFRMEKSLQKHD